MPLIASGYLPTAEERGILCSPALRLPLLTFDWDMKYCRSTNMMLKCEAWRIHYTSHMLWAHLSELSVSLKQSSLGLMLTNIRVLLFPPSELWRRWVSLESLYGTWPFWNKNFKLQRERDILSDTSTQAYISKVWSARCFLYELPMR